MTGILPQLLLQLILILVNAFFAATEIAVISLNEKKLKARAEDGDRKAVRMLRMVEEPTQFLSTIQIGITLAGFLGSAFAADNFAARLTDLMVKSLGLPETQAEALNTVAVILITLVLSYFTLVLGELVPKRVAMKHKEKLAEAVCGLVSGLATVLRPVIWLLTASTNGVLRLFGIDPEEKEQPVSEEDIVLMLDAGADEGSLSQNDIEYIKNVFKLDDMTAEDVMTPRRSFVTVDIQASKEEVLELIKQEGYSRIPVYEDNQDNIVGILFTRDFLLSYTDPDFKLQDAMFQPTFVPESAHLDTLFKDMQKDHNHMVMVVNEYGETAGIVTMEDILEEIVGEIWDEGDEEVKDIVLQEDGSVKVLCSTYIDNFFEYFDLEEDPETEATTVNGWLTEQAGTIPDEGYSFRYQGLEISVTKADDMMAQEILVRRLPETEKASGDGEG